MKPSCELQYKEPCPNPGHLTHQTFERLLASNIVSHLTYPKLHLATFNKRKSYESQAQTPHIFLQANQSKTYNVTTIITFHWNPNEKIAWHLRVVCDAVHSSKIGTVHWLNTMHSGKKWWIWESVPPLIYTFFLNPDYAAACSLRSLCSNNFGFMINFLLCIRIKSIFPVYYFMLI